MKKKFFNVFALIMVLVFTVVSCGEKKEEKKQDTQVKQEVKKEDGVIRVAAIKGPPAMGLVKLFADNEEGKTLNKYDTKIVNTPDEIAALVGKGEVDIASIPSNLASVLYNKTGGKNSDGFNNSLWNTLYCRKWWRNSKKCERFKRKNNISEQQRVNT